MREFGLWRVVAWTVVALAACGGGQAEPADTTAPAPDLGDTVTRDVAATDVPRPRDVADGAGEDVWELDRDAHPAVHGWILLDPDPEAMAATIDTAARFGVNHVELSHGLIMNIDELLGDSPEVETRAETLRTGIERAHAHGMEAFVWAHEWSGLDNADLCYEPGSAAWTARAAAYRDALARIPEVDGVVLMFGSAPMPPWFTVCSCDWCRESYPGGGDPFFGPPPQAERIRLVTSELGAVLVDELGKQLFVRTFVHEPEEIAWHNDGLSAVTDPPFTGMHKAPVQDWQHDP